MRIFYAAGSSPNAYDISQSRLWEHNLYDSLVALGHQVIPFSMDINRHFTLYKHYRTNPAERSLFQAYRQKLQETLLAEIRAAHQQGGIDLFFSYFWSEICDPATIDQIRSLGITTVNWYCNGSYQFDLVADLAPHYDWCLVPEKFRLDDYRGVGARPLYCQEAANPDIYHPWDLPREFDVTFVGQAYGDRPEHVAYLRRHGIDARVWGAGWERYLPSSLKPSQNLGGIARKLLTAEGWRIARRRLQGICSAMGSDSPLRGEKAELPPQAVGGVLSDQEMIQMYSRSKINLGFSSCGATHQQGERILQVRLRDFEVPMSGGFYMVEYMEELEEFFEIGKEIVCYSGPQDLVEKIRYYLDHEEQREAIRLAGLQRCRRDHTWQKRFQDAFHAMGLA